MSVVIFALVGCLIGGGVAVGAYYITKSIQAKNKKNKNDKTDENK